MTQTQLKETEEQLLDQLSTCKDDKIEIFNQLKMISNARVRLNKPSHSNTICEAFISNTWQGALILDVQEFSQTVHLCFVATQE